ncbi:MAG: LysM peptidoglycan-binding domain-containing protein [Thermoanaerobaculia bacterium]|jgi:LysM repeat protein
MGLFGKSFEDKVHAAIETLRGQFPMAQIAADIADEVVTLKGHAPDVNIKGQIMAAFNQLVETKNTINQIALDKPAAAPAPVAAPAAPAPAAAAPMVGPPAPTGPKIHEVVSGETLSKISKHYYGDANKYMKIFEANTDILKNPDLIKVGQKLKIPE